MSLGDSLRAARDGEGDWQPPDGWQGQVRIVDAGAFTARTSGNDFAKTTLQVVGGEYAGRQFDHLMALSSRALAITTESLLVYGVNIDAVDGLEDLDNQMGELIRKGWTYDITVKINDTFLNVNVHGARTGKSDITPATDGLAQTDRPLPGQQTFDDVITPAPAVPDTGKPPWED